MTQSTLTLGEQIRSRRQERGWSLSDFATRAGFSKGFLSKIENGHAQPPIATLMKLAEALDLGIGELFDGPRPPGAARAVLTRADEREQVAHSDERGYAFERLATGSPFRMTPYIIHLDEDQDEPPPSLQHPGEEIVHVLTGELDYLAAGEVHRLRRGDTLVFDASRPHCAIKLPDQTASFIAIFAGEPG